jgi:hypothetical protein
MSDKTYWINLANEAIETGDVEELMESIGYYMNYTSTDEIDLTLFEMYEACDAGDIELLERLVAKFSNE